MLFAFVPPVAIFDGWLCFFVSLTLIGIITTIIQDLATVFGCLIGLDDTMTGEILLHIALQIQHCRRIKSIFVDWK